jgi:two-component system response regulator AlgR
MASRPSSRYRWRWKTSASSAALRLVDALEPDLVLLDMTMPEVDGLTVARSLGRREQRCPAVIFVTAHDNFAVEAFDCDAVDYVLKPVAPERLERAIERALKRREPQENVAENDGWLREFWVPHRSELLRVEAAMVDRIDAERDYVRLHVGDNSYMLLQTIAGLEQQLDPDEFIRIHRSTILRRDRIRGLRHEGMGVWSAETESGDALRIGRTYLAKVKKMAGK